MTTSHIASTGEAEREPLTVEHWQPLRDQIAETLGVDPATLHPHPEEEK